MVRDSKGELSVVEFKDLLPFPFPDRTSANMALPVEKHTSLETGVEKSA